VAEFSAGVNLIISPKEMTTLANGFGMKKLSQLLKYHALSAET